MMSPDSRAIARTGIPARPVQYKQCLIADRDGVYDPGNCVVDYCWDSKFAELELHAIRARLTAGIFRQASG